MYCYELTTTPQLLAGTTLRIAECDGLIVHPGDILIVKAPLAGALYVKYREYLTEPKLVYVDMKTLKQGAWEWIPKMPQTLEDKKLDASMGSSRAAKKRRHK